MATRRAKPRGQRRSAGKPAPVIARPLESAVFLLPLLLIYELGSLFIHRSGVLQRQDRVVAFHLLRQMLERLGTTAVWMPPLAVVVILLCMHVASRRPWRVDVWAVLWMYAESIGLALPMLLVSRFVHLAGSSAPVSSLLDEMVLGIGAGVYEELVFRLVLVSAMVMVGVDLLKLPASPTAVFAIMLSAALFASHHHPPLGSEPFAAGRFLFRFLAGAYLGAIFYYRGYGPAAGAHVAYNTMAVVIAAF